MGVMTSGRRITTVTGDLAAERVDDVAVEEPLTIVVAGAARATTMRTPGHDLELTAGWLVGEGVVRVADDIVLMKALSADPDSRDEVDTVRVTLAPHLHAPEPRALLTSSSCGVCSSRLLRDVPPPSAPLHDAGWSVSPETLQALPERMRSRQRAFDRTGGLHAAAVASPDGELLVVREDVGRHNAVDKVVGERLLAGHLPLTGHLLTVSGRVSFEIVQKALAACVGGVVAVSAPSSLAVDLAREHGLLLVGLTRGTRMNVYSGAPQVTARH